MEYHSINLHEKLGKFEEYWKPRIVSQFNNYHVKLAKIKGEFVWHTHSDTDELFFVIDGSLDVVLRDGRVTLGAGEMFVVPKGVEHKPFAARECHIMLIEPAGTLNTGADVNAMTAPDDVWV